MTEDEIGFGQHISQSNGNKLIERDNPEVIIPHFLRLFIDTPPYIIL